MEQTGWIIDSGASTHVCYDKEILQMAYRLEKVAMVHMPDGNTREVSVAGKVRVNQEIVLQDVLYVPGFTHNLLSVAQLIRDSGIRYVFTHIVSCRG